MVVPENRSGAYLKYASTGSAGNLHAQAGLTRISIGPKKEAPDRGKRREPRTSAGGSAREVQKTLGVVVSGAALAIMRTERALCTPDCAAMTRRHSALSAPQA